MNITQTEIEATVKAHYGGGLDPSEIWAQCAAYHIAEMYQMPPGETMRCGIGDAFLRMKMPMKMPVMYGIRFTSPLVMLMIL